MFVLEGAKSRVTSPATQIALSEAGFQDQEPQPAESQVYTLVVYTLIPSSYLTVRHWKWPIEIDGLPWFTY